MKIELDVDLENNEGTDSPYWLIIDPSWLPKSTLKDDPDQALHIVASMINGPFFSREEAQYFLNATNYNFSKNAKVYCHSGYSSHKYKMACRNAELKQANDENA